MPKPNLNKQKMFSTYPDWSIPKSWRNKKNFSFRWSVKRSVKRSVKTVGQTVSQDPWPTDIGHGHDRSWPVMTMTIAIPKSGIPCFQLLSRLSCILIMSILSLNLTMFSLSICLGWWARTSVPNFQIGFGLDQLKIRTRSELIRIWK